MAYLLERDVVARLVARVDAMGGLRPAARAWGVSVGLLSMVLAGTRPPRGKLLRVLGLRERTVYEVVKTTRRMTT